MSETPSVSAAGEPASPERVRARRVIALTSALTVIVVGGVIALGIRERRSAASPRAYGVQDLWGDPYRSTPWPEGGCEPDREHPPRLVFDLPPEGLDFGAVKQGVQLQREVLFRNEGSGPLCIRDTSSGCGCIKAVLDGEQRKFEPGQGGRLLVTLDTTGRDGVQKKVISLVTNSLDAPMQTFAVRASITQGLVVEPSRLSFPRSTRGRSAEARLRLRSPKEDADWTVTGLTGEVPLDGAPVAYTFRLEPLADPERTVVDVVIRHPGASREALLRDELVVTTTHPDRPTIRVPADLLVVAPILAVPPRAIVGFVSAQAVARIRLDAGDETTSFDVEGVELRTVDGSDVPRGGTGFLAEPRRAEDGTWWIDVRYDGKPREPQQLRATLVVKTTHPDLRALEIPCLATVPEPPR